MITPPQVRGDHFSGEEEKNNRLEIEPDAVDHARQDLFEHHAVGHVRIARAERQRLDDLLIRDTFGQIERVEQHRRGHADHDQHDFRKLVDAERNE